MGATGASRGPSSRSRLGETGHGDDLHVTLIEVDYRDQVVDEGDLEGRSFAVDNETVLGQTGNDAHHHPEPIAVDGARLETHQILWPELAFLEGSPPFDKDFRPPERFSPLTIIDSLEGDLKALVDTTNRSHLLGVVVDPDGGTGVEVDDVLGLYVETEKPSETVGPPQSPDPVIGAFSRRTRRQL